MRRLMLAAVIAAISASESPADIIGRASVIDGDTIDIAGERIRFNGIDAPEASQLCEDMAGAKYRCGQRAALDLADWLDGAQPIRCAKDGRDRYGRTIATCFRAGSDVAAWLVRSGLALDWPRYSKGKYAAAQAEAEAARRGLWAGSFEPPWEWRRR